jgi:hypothetical protein
MTVKRGASYLGLHPIIVILCLQTPQKKVNVILCLLIPSQGAEQPDPSEASG